MQTFQICNKKMHLLVLNKSDRDTDEKTIWATDYVIIAFTIWM